MAKLHGAAKAAFLARMARGRKKTHRKSKARKASAPKRARARRASPLKGRKHTHRHKVGGYRRKASVASHTRRTNPEMITMPAALIANPRKRRKGGKRRRRNILVSTNPRRRRRRGGGGFRTNPSGIIGSIMKEAIPSTVAGAIVGFIDAKVAGKSALISYGSKVGLAIIGQVVGSKLPMGIGSAITSAAFASIGYGFGMKMGGGVVAGSKDATAKELAAMAAEDSDFASILGAELQGMGLLVGTMGEEGDPGVMGEEDMAGLTDGNIGDDND